MFSVQSYGSSISSMGPPPGFEARFTCPSYGRDPATGRHVEDILCVAAKKNRQLSAMKSRPLCRTLLQRQFWSTIQDENEKAVQQRRQHRIQQQQQPMGFLSPASPLMSSPLLATRGSLGWEDGFGTVGEASLPAEVVSPALVESNLRSDKDMEDKDMEDMEDMEEDGDLDLLHQLPLPTAKAENGYEDDDMSLDEQSNKTTKTTTNNGSVWGSSFVWLAHPGAQLQPFGSPWVTSTKENQSPAEKCRGDKRERDHSVSPVWNSHDCNSQQSCVVGGMRKKLRGDESCGSAALSAFNWRHPLHPIESNTGGYGHGVFPQAIQA